MHGSWSCLLKESSMSRIFSMKIPGHSQSSLWLILWTAQVKLTPSRPPLPTYTLWTNFWTKSTSQLVQWVSEFITISWSLLNTCPWQTLPAIVHVQCCAQFTYIHLYAHVQYFDLQNRAVGTYGYEWADSSQYLDSDMRYLNLRVTKYANGTIHPTHLKSVKRGEKPVSGGKQKQAGLAIAYIYPARMCKK